MKKIFLLLLLIPIFSFRSVTVGEDVFFGDSITFGNELGLLQFTARWSTQYCTAVPTDELNEARSGASMATNAYNRPVFDINDVPVYQSSYRHIFVSYWVNDYLYGSTPAAFAAATTTAVNGILAKGWPAAKIVLCFNYLPDSPNTWIDMTNAKAQQWLAALRGVQQAKGTSFLDFYTLINNRPDKATYSPDLIHPTAAWNTIMKQYAQTNIESPSSSLPVSIVSFAGQRQGTATVLKWNVAQEQNVDRYEIEKSIDGSHWTRAGEVLSLGNTAAQRSYAFTDNAAAGAKQFYRLRSVDKNGAFKFSNVVIINGVKAAQLSLSGLFPNPAKANLSLLVESPVKEQVTIELVDPMGRIVKSQTQNLETGTNTLAVSVSSLSAGAYVVRVNGQTGQNVSVGRFIKE